MDALAGRLTVALELLAQLLGAVQLQPNTVLPLLRTVSQILTVQDLQMLQVKAIGVLLYLQHSFLHPPCILGSLLATVKLRRKADGGWHCCQRMS